ncbi:MAG: ATP-binding cassette domain-containing protein [Terricaulis sp.]|nr:ATP-binding cassette domain-containing protein [Terricaulis sp.]
MLLQVDGLRKSFGRRLAVDGVGFTLDVGEIVGFLGPNGAGKTTTMRMIAGYLEPDEGVVRIFNIDVAQERRRAQERLGYLPEGAPLYRRDDALDLSALHRRGARGMNRDAARRAVRGAAQDARLGDLIGPADRHPLQRLSPPRGPCGGAAARSHAADPR